MKKNISTKFIMAGVALLALGACSEPDDELTSVTYNRNFSPVNVEARVTNKTNVRLSWAAVEGATSYNIEAFANDSLTFSGTAAKTITGVTSSPYTVTGLEGETPYSFRIQAVTEGDPSRDSKWIGVYAKTEAEQILYAVADEDIKAKQVTLRWPAGEEAATFVLTPGNIVYNITAADIAAGAATITGLTPETEYKAVMARATGKTRGSVTFKTGIELAETDILVNAGDDLSAAIAAAPAGYRLVLMPGEYGLPTEEASFGGSVTITKELSIKGLRPAEHPVIKGRIKVEAALSIDQVTLDGEGTDGGQCFDFTADDNQVDHLTITNCEVKNYTKGFLYINKTTVVNTITIDGCIISNIECSGGDFFDSRNGGYNQFNLVNSTIYNSAKSRDVFRMDDASSKVTATPNIKVDHCTFSQVGSGNANYRFFYVRFPGNNITFTNNIVTDFNNKRGFANQSSTDAEPTLANNYYWNTVNLISKADGNEEKITWFDEAGKNVDPQFKDAANGDFTIQNEDVSFAKVGDPRWQ